MISVKGLLLGLGVFLAGFHTNGAKIIVTGKSGESQVGVKETQKIFSEYLKRISPKSNAEFVLGLAGDFPEFKNKFKLNDLDHQDDYLFFYKDNIQYLVGATPVGLRHAVYDYLARLGYRQYFPGKIWEYIPEKNDVQLRLNKFVSPDFCSRSLGVMYGLYKNMSACKPWYHWYDANRVTSSINRPGGHTGESIYRKYRKVFAKHPEWLGLVKGKRVSHKFCLSNPELRRFIVKIQLEKLLKRAETQSFPGVSMEPSDGYQDWCECESCRKLGDPSTRLMILANELARAVRQKSDNGYVWILAYNRHASAPRINAEKNVIVTLCNGHLRGGVAFSDLIETWPQKVDTSLGVYNYWGVHPYIWGRPNSIFNRPKEIDQQFAAFNAGKIKRFHSIVSRDFGVYGLGMYYVSQLLWSRDGALNPEKIKSEFCRNMFGSASEEMRKYFDLIFSDNKDGLEFSSAMLGRMYRILQDAQRLAKRPEVKARVNAYIYFTSYLEILKKKKIAVDDAAAFELFSIAVRLSDACLVDDKATLRDLCRYRKLNKKQRVAMAVDWNRKANKLPKFDLNDNIAPRKILDRGIRENSLISLSRKIFKSSMTRMHLSRKVAFTPRLGIFRNKQKFLIYPDAKGRFQDVKVKSGIIYPENGPGKWSISDFDTGATITSGVLPADGKFHELQFDKKILNKKKYYLYLNDYGMGSQIQINSANLAWLTNESGSFSAMKSGGAFIAYIPSGITQIMLYGSCNAVFFPLTETGKKIRIKVNEDYALIPVHKYSGQPWGISCTGNFELKFLNIPQVLSLDEGVFFKPETD